MAKRRRIDNLLVVHAPACAPSWADGFPCRESPRHTGPGVPADCIHVCTPLCASYRAWQRALARTDRVLRVLNGGRR